MKPLVAVGLTVLLLASGDAPTAPPAASSASYPAAGPAPQGVTIDDALAIRNTGALVANRQRALLAIEAEGSTLVLDAADGRVVKRLSGQRPQWSPDGAMLAFFSRQSGLNQLHVWRVDSDSEQQLTRLPLGVLPNGRTMGATCDPQRVAWSPDSAALAFTSMLLSEHGIPASDSDPPEVRVFRSTARDRRSPVEAIYRNRAATEGLYTADNHWRSQFPHDPVATEVLEHAGQSPWRTANRIVRVEIHSGDTTFLPGEAAQYFCPAWAPDGHVLASVADLSDYTISNDQYGALGVPVRSTVALHDFRSGQERLIRSGAFERVRSVLWTAEHHRLIALVESGPKPIGFTRLTSISAADGSSTLVDVPDGRAVKDIRAGPDGTFAIRLAGRFVDTLWMHDPQEARFDQMPTHDWSVADFDLLDSQRIAFWAESSDFKGRLVISGPGGPSRVLYDANPQTVDLPLGEQRRFTWRNRHGEELDGILIFPPDHDPGRRYPVVVDAYPAPATDRFRLSPFIEDTGQLLAAQGFVVFRPAVRAPHGGYWFTHAETYHSKAVGAPGVSLLVDDFESGIEALVEQGITDPDRIGLYGHSNGGWAANFLVTESKLPKAAVIQSGVSNAIMVALWPNVKVTRGIDAASGGNVFDDFDDYVRLSPIFRMRDVAIPLLLMVGDQDYPWVPQMISQYGVLRAEGRDATLVRYANEGHTIAKRENAVDALQRITAFFDEHLGRPGTSSTEEGTETNGSAMRRP